jgi:hypothetical protein
MNAALVRVCLFCLAVSAWAGGSVFAQPCTKTFGATAVTTPVQRFENDFSFPGITVQVEEYGLRTYAIKVQETDLA